MNKLTVYTSTGQAIQELDIGEEITAPFTYKLADIRDPAVKGGSFSKTIKLPGTRNNNLFFGGLYDVNADYSLFNPNLKTYVRWIASDEEVLSGYMKLSKVYVDDLDDVWYEVVIFDTTVDLWNEIEGKYCFELSNLSELSHVWNGTNIKASWTTDWNQRGYFYPLTKNALTISGNLLNSPLTTYTERLYPAVFHKRLLDMILRDHGYTWSGTLKSNAVYEREIIPYTGDHPNVVLSDAAKRKFKAGWNVDQVGYSSFHGATVNAGYIRNPNRTDWNFLGTTPFPDEAGGGYGFNDNYGVWASPLYTAPEAGQYAFNLNLPLRAQLQYYKSGGNLNHALDYAVNFMVYAEVNTGSGTVVSNGIALNPFVWYFPKDIGNTSSTFITQDVSTSLTFPASSVLGSYTNGNYFVLQPGWTVRFYLGYSSTGLRNAVSNHNPYYDNNLDANKDFRIESFGFKMRGGAFVECNDSLSAYGQGFLIPYGAFINKKMKQKDIFSDLIARYNVHIYLNPDKENDIVIDTGETFYDPAPADTADWSMLKENDEHDSIQHMAELQNEKFLLTYQQSGDEFSKVYTGSTGEVYGQHEHTFTNAFVQGVRKIDTPFTETPLIEYARVFFPAVEAKEKDGAMRVWYAPKGGIQLKEYSSSRYFLLKAADGDHTLGVSGSFYPYAGHLQNPNRINDTTVYDVTNDNDINFGTLAFMFPQMLSGVTSLTPYTLEERYWFKRIDQMNRGKMLSTLLNLTSRHINLIRKKPYTRIWINNAYWQVNKIEFEGNDQLRKLTPVELISIHNLKHLPGRIIKPVRPVVGGVLTPWSPAVSGTNAVGNGVSNYDVKGMYNKIGDNVVDVFITGNENEVFPGVKGVNIQNSNRVVVKGSNVTVIDTSDLTIASDNVTIIKGVLFQGEEQTRLYNLIDGGEDEIRAIGADAKYNLIDSGKNVNLNRFAQNPIALIDSQTGENKTIRTNGIDSN